MMRRASLPPLRSSGCPPSSCSPPSRSSPWRRSCPASTGSPTRRSGPAFAAYPVLMLLVPALWWLAVKRREPDADAALRRVRTGDGRASWSTPPATASTSTTPSSGGTTRTTSSTGSSCSRHRADHRRGRAARLGAGATGRRARLPARAGLGARRVVHVHPARHRLDTAYEDTLGDMTLGSRAPSSRCAGRRAGNVSPVSQGLHVAVATRAFRRYSTYRAATLSGIFTDSVFGIIYALRLSRCGTPHPHAGGYDARRRRYLRLARPGNDHAVALWGGGTPSDLARADQVG